MSVLFTGLSLAQELAHSAKVFVEREDVWLQIQVKLSSCLWTDDVFPPGMSISKVHFLSFSFPDSGLLLTSNTCFFKSYWVNSHSRWLLTCWSLTRHISKQIELRGPLCFLLTDLLYFSSTVSSPWSMCYLLSLFNLWLLRSIKYWFRKPQPVWVSSLETSLNEAGKKPAIF